MALQQFCGKFRVLLQGGCQGCQIQGTETPELLPCPIQFPLHPAAQAVLQEDEQNPQHTAAGSQEDQSGNDPAEVTALSGLCTGLSTGYGGAVTLVSGGAPGTPVLLFGDPVTGGRGSCPGGLTAGGLRHQISGSIIRAIFRERSSGEQIRDQVEARKTQKSGTRVLSL